MTQCVFCAVAMNVPNKSPISILQERAMSSGTPLPDYTITQDGTNFKCVVKFGTTRVESVGDNKKKAKHNAAAKALYELTGNVYVDESYESSPQIANCGSRIMNAVGQLNELCSKNCDIKPTYEDRFANAVPNSDFIINCKLFDYETEGSGRTKKEAKQAAALKMLNIIKHEDFVRFARNSENTQNDCSGEADGTIIEIFKRLSIARNKRNDNTVDPISDNNNNNDVNESIKLDYEFLNKTDNAAHLKEALATLRITFTIIEIQKNPLVLALRTGSTPPHTFLHSASTYEDTELVLLKKSLNGIAILNNHC